MMIPLGSRTCPVNELVHILPIGGLIAKEVVSTLRRAHRAGREEDCSVTNLSFIILVLVGFHERRLLEAGSKRHT